MIGIKLPSAPSMRDAQIAGRHLEHVELAIARCSP
jgi:hypothetical protein